MIAVTRPLTSRRACVSSDKLIATFGELMDVINKGPGARVGTPSLMESGLLFPIVSFDHDYRCEKGSSEVGGEHDSSEQSFNEALVGLDI